MRIGDSAPVLYRELCSYSDWIVSGSRVIGVCRIPSSKKIGPAALESKFCILGFEPGLGNNVNCFRRVRFNGTGQEPQDSNQ